MSVKTVAPWMRQAGLRARVARQYQAPTNSRHDFPVAENVLNRQLTTAQLHAVWMADITYGTPSDAPARSGRNASESWCGMQDPQGWVLPSPGDAGE